jgi:hypothetical protein
VLWANLDPALAAFALLGRAAQLASTRFVSRNLVPEAASFARRLGWPVGLAALPSRASHLCQPLVLRMSS